MYNKLKTVYLLLVITMMSLVVGCNTNIGTSNTDTPKNTITQTDADIIATVNGEGITKEEFDLYVESYKSGIIETMVQDKILLQVAKEQGVEVTEEEINSEIENYKNTLGSEEAFEQLLLDNKTTLKGFKLNIENLLTRNKLADKLEGEIEITDEDAKQVYDSDPSRYKTADVIEIVADNKETIVEVETLLKEGKTVDQIVETMGDKLQLAELVEGISLTNGVLGRAIDNLEVGETHVSENEGTGYAVYKLVKVKSTFEEVKDLIIEDTKSSLRYTELNSLIDEAVEKAVIEYEDEK